jgi:hypothetical protein
MAPASGNITHTILNEFVHQFLVFFHFFLLKPRKLSFLRSSGGVNRKNQFDSKEERKTIFSKCDFLQNKNGCFFSLMLIGVVG